MVASCPPHCQPNEWRGAEEQPARTSPLSPYSVRLAVRPAASWTWTLWILFGHEWSRSDQIGSIDNTTADDEPDSEAEHAWSGAVRSTAARDARERGQTNQLDDATPGQEQQASTDTTDSNARSGTGGDADRSPSTHDGPEPAEERTIRRKQQSRAEQSPTGGGSGASTILFTSTMEAAGAAGRQGGGRRAKQQITLAICFVREGEGRGKVCLSAVLSSCCCILLAAAVRFCSNTGREHGNRKRARRGTEKGRTTDEGKRAGQRKEQTGRTKETHTADSHRSSLTTPRKWRE